MVCTDEFYAGGGEEPCDQLASHPDVERSNNIPPPQAFFFSFIPFPSEELFAL